MSAIKDGRSSNKNKGYCSKKDYGQAEAMEKILRSARRANSRSIQQGEYASFYYGREISEPAKCVITLRGRGLVVDTFRSNNTYSDYVLNPKVNEVDDLGFPTFIFCPVIEDDGTPSFIDLSCQEGFGFKMIDKGNLGQYKDFVERRNKLMPNHLDKIKAYKAEQARLKELNKKKVS